MGEAPAAAFSLVLAGQRRGPAPHCFRMPRRRKVHVVRLGGGGGGRGGLCLRRIRLRWLRRAVWRLAEFCAAALSAPLGAAAASPWKGAAVDPYAFAAPFVPAMLLKRPGKGF
uniref:Uncharacterized protein n=1 Tax=Leersia perrieri TaxID=77586 RepID=A0A0D9W5I4_9ORYZ